MISEYSASESRDSHATNDLMRRKSTNLCPERRLRAFLRWDWRMLPPTRSPTSKNP